MEYSGYLIHFNPNHDPKTGRFDFSKGFDSKVKYGGKKRSEYVKDMKEQYKANGYSSSKASKYAKTAADQNQWETYQYNKSINKFKKISEEMYDILDKNGNNRDDKRVRELAKKLVQEYKNANSLEVLLANDYAIGEMFTRSYADALAGVPKYNKDNIMKSKTVVLFNQKKQQDAINAQYKNIDVTKLRSSQISDLAEKAPFGSDVKEVNNNAMRNYISRYGKIPDFTNGYDAKNYEYALDGAENDYYEKHPDEWERVQKSNS